MTDVRELFPDPGNRAGRVSFIHGTTSTEYGPELRQATRMPRSAYLGFALALPILSPMTLTIPGVVTAAGSGQFVWETAQQRIVDWPLRAARVRQQSSRLRELEWVRNNRDALRQHLGEWVVIEGDALVAADHDYTAALRRAREAGIRTPFIFKLWEEFSLAGFD